MLRLIEKSLEYFTFNGKETIRKKIKVSFIIYFCFDKRSFYLDGFWKSIVDEWKSCGIGRR